MMNNLKKENKDVKKWFYWFSLIVALIIVYKLLDSLSAIGSWISNFLSVVSPFIIGVIIAYILYLPSRKLERLLSKVKCLKKRARGLSILIVYAIVTIIFIVAIRFLIPPLVTSFQDLVNNLQAYYVGIKNNISQLPEDSILKSEFATNILNALTNFKIEEYINLNMITEYAQELINFATGIFDIFVSIIVSIYLLLERRQIVKFFKKLIESSCSKQVFNNVGKYFKKTNEIFCNFLIGQILDAIVVGILASVAMSIMGVKYAVMLGIFIGVFNMIPYFGAIIAVIVSIFVTILTGGLPQAVEMGIVVVILQQVDANIINPKIVGDQVKISPLLVILSVTIGGAYFGIMGMFLAVPFAALTKVLLDDLIEYNYYKKGLKKENCQEIDK